MPRSHKVMTFIFVISHVTRRRRHALTVSAPEGPSVSRHAPSDLLFWLRCLEAHLSTVNQAFPGPLNAVMGVEDGEHISA